MLSKDKPETRRYAVRVTEKMGDFLESRALETGQSVSAVIAFALTEWMEQKSTIAMMEKLLVAYNQQQSKGESSSADTH